MDNGTVINTHVEIHTINGQVWSFVRDQLHPGAPRHYDGVGPLLQLAEIVSVFLAT